MWPFDFFAKKKPEPKVEELAAKEIREKDDKIKVFEAKIADIEAKRKKLTENVQLAESAVEKWGKIKDAAAEIGNEAYIRDAVRNHLEAKQKHENMLEELSSMDKLMAGLKEQLQFAHDKVDCSEAHVANLTARLEAAIIRADLADEPVKLTALEDKTIEAESKAEAKEETSDYQQEFLKKNVVPNLDVEFEVKRLMKKKGKATNSTVN